MYTSVFRVFSSLLVCVYNIAVEAMPLAAGDTNMVQDRIRSNYTVFMPENEIIDSVKASSVIKSTSSISTTPVEVKPDILQTEYPVDISVSEESNCIGTASPANQENIRNKNGSEIRNSNKMCENLHQTFNALDTSATNQAQSELSILLRIQSALFSQLEPEELLGNPEPTDEEKYVNSALDYPDVYILTGVKSTVSENHIRNKLDVDNDTDFEIGDKNQKNTTEGKNSVRNEENLHQNHEGKNISNEINLPVSNNLRIISKSGNDPEQEKLNLNAGKNILVNTNMEKVSLEADHFIIVPEDIDPQVDFDRKVMGNVVLESEINIFEEPFSHECQYGKKESELVERVSEISYLNLTDVGSKNVSIQKSLYSEENKGCSLHGMLGKNHEQFSPVEFEEGLGQRGGLGLENITVLEIYPPNISNVSEPLGDDFYLKETDVLLVSFKSESVLIVKDNNISETAEGSESIGVGLNNSEYFNHPSISETIHQSHKSGSTIEDMESVLPDEFLKELSSKTNFPNSKLERLKSITSTTGNSLTSFLSVQTSNCSISQPAGKQR